MRFVLELWVPRHDDGSEPTAAELLHYAITSASENPDLTWDIFDDAGNPLHPNVSITGEEESDENRP